MISNINHYWLDPSWYNFMSSEWGGTVVKLVGLAIFTFFVRWGWKKVHHHLECEVQGCERLGHPVHGTSHRACKEHHPHLDPAGHTEDHISRQAEKTHDSG